MYVQKNNNIGTCKSMRLKTEEYVVGTVLYKLE